MVEQRRGIADHASRTARRLRGSAYRTRFRCLDVEATPWTTHNPALGSSSNATTPLFRPTGLLSRIIAGAGSTSAVLGLDLAEKPDKEKRINEERTVSSVEAGFEDPGRSLEKHVDTKSIRGVEELTCLNLTCRIRGILRSWQFGDVCDESCLRCSNSCWDLIVVEFYRWRRLIRHVNDREFFFFLDLEVIWTCLKKYR